LSRASGLAVRIAVLMIGGMISSTPADADRDPGYLRAGQGIRIAP
jgi:hypothetical protein